MKTFFALVAGLALGVFATYHYASDAAKKQIQDSAQQDLSHKGTDLRRKTASVISPDTK